MFQASLRECRQELQKHGLASHRHSCPARSIAPSDLPNFAAHLEAPPESETIWRTGDGPCGWPRVLPIEFRMNLKISLCPVCLEPAHPGACAEAVGGVPRPAAELGLPEAAGPVEDPGVLDEVSAT